MSDTIQDAYQAMIENIIDQGGPAFPSDFSGMSFVGMTMRDWFAGQALAGFIAYGGQAVEGARAKQAYKVADAMLAERNRK